MGSVVWIIFMCFTACLTKSLIDEQPKDNSDMRAPRLQGPVEPELDTAPPVEDSPIIQPIEDRDLGPPRPLNPVSYEEDITELQNRVTRIEDSLTLIQNGMQSLQTEVKSFRKLKSGPPVQTGNHFDMKSGKQIFTYDWYVDNVSQFNTTYQEDDFIKSPKFYISPRGYRMFMGTYPVGRSSLSTLSLDYLGIYGGPARGAFDSQQAWPFRLRYDMCIVDQTDDNPHNIETTVWPGYTCGKKPEESSSPFAPTSSAYKLFYHDVIVDRYQEDIACGDPYLISRELLATRSYIKNDRILFRMKVHLA